MNGRWGVDPSPLPPSWWVMGGQLPPPGFDFPGAPIFKPKFSDGAADPKGSHFTMVGGGSFPCLHPWVGGLTPPSPNLSVQLYVP